MVSFDEAKSKINPEVVEIQFAAVVSGIVATSDDVVQEPGVMQFVVTFEVVGPVEAIASDLSIHR